MEILKILAGLCFIASISSVVAYVMLQRRTKRRNENITVSEFQDEMEY